MTIGEIEAKNLNRSVKGDTSKIDRENILLEDLNEMLPEHIEILNLGSVAEHGSADAYFKVTK